MPDIANQKMLDDEISSLFKKSVRDHPLLKNWVKKKCRAWLSERQDCVVHLMHREVYPGDLPDWAEKKLSEGQAVDIFTMSAGARDMLSHVGDFALDLIKNLESGDEEVRNKSEKTLKGFFHKDPKDLFEMANTYFDNLNNGFVKGGGRSRRQLFEEEETEENTLKTASGKIWKRVLPRGLKTVAVSLNNCLGGVRYANSVRSGKSEVWVLIDDTENFDPMTDLLVAANFDVATQKFDEIKGPNNSSASPHLEEVISIEAHKECRDSYSKRYMKTNFFGATFMPAHERKGMKTHQTPEGLTIGTKTYKSDDGSFQYHKQYLILSETEVLELVTLTHGLKSNARSLTVDNRALFFQGNLDYSLCKAVSENIKIMLDDIEEDDDLKIIGFATQLFVDENRKVKNPADEIILSKESDAASLFVFSDGTAAFLPFTNYQEEMNNRIQVNRLWDVSEEDRARLKSDISDIEKERVLKKSPRIMEGTSGHNIPHYLQAVSHFDGLKLPDLDRTGLTLDLSHQITVVMNLNCYEFVRNFLGKHCEVEALPELADAGIKQVRHAGVTFLVEENNDELSFVAAICKPKGGGPRVFVGSASMTSRSVKLFDYLASIDADLNLRSNSFITGECYRGTALSEAKMRPECDPEYPVLEVKSPRRFIGVIRGEDGTIENGRVAWTASVKKRIKDITIQDIDFKDEDAVDHLIKNQLKAGYSVEVCNSTAYRISPRHTLEESPYQISKGMILKKAFPELDGFSSGNIYLERMGGSSTDGLNLNWYIKARDVNYRGEDFGSIQVRNGSSARIQINQFNMDRLGKKADDNQYWKGYTDVVEHCIKVTGLEVSGFMSAFAGLDGVRSEAAFFDQEFGVGPGYSVKRTRDLSKGYCFELLDQGNVIGYLDEKTMSFTRSEMDASKIKEFAEAAAVFYDAVENRTLKDLEVRPENEKRLKSA